MEFADGEQYVGKAENVVSRYQSHRHGSDHHEPWTDIVAIQFAQVPKGDLDALERGEITRRRQQVTLRNKVHNFGHAQPSPLDPLVPIPFQKHWATGDPDYDLESFVQAAQRKRGPTPKLLRSKQAQELLPDGRPVWQAVVDELALIVAECIPNAVETEGSFWSISDYPATARGRFATLNVGTMELAAFPRVTMEEEGVLTPSKGHTWYLNASAGTFVPPGTDPDDLPKGYVYELDGWPEGMPFWISSRPRSYAVPVDVLMMPLGVLGLAWLGEEEVLGVRRLAIQAMRQGSARVNSRSYSAELTRLVYERIAQWIREEDEDPTV